MALQNDGKLLIAQSFTNQTRLIRVNADGSPDVEFVSNANEWISRILAQPDGKILAGSPAGAVISRLNGDGTPDSSFGQAGSLWLERIDDVALLAGDRLAVFGEFAWLNQCLFDNCEGSANLLVLSSGGQFESEAGRLRGEYWGPQRYPKTRRALPLIEGGFLLLGNIARVNSPFGFDLIRVQPSPVMQSSQRNPDGSVGLRIGGRPDWTYTLEASTNLVNWTYLRDLPSEGLTTPFSDRPLADEVQRFYRATLKR
ncbi:MAG TPA: hypothetical protein PLX89_08225 [Verrucomicrobiota bacterium]|nr:hypothetical protein [Verrucomicrobiota bacterium]